MDQLLFQMHFEPLNSKPVGFDFEMTGKGCSPFFLCSEKGGTVKPTVPVDAVRTSEKTSYDNKMCHKRNFAKKLQHRPAGQLQTVKIT